jgi:hypothetical protein
MEYPTEEMIAVRLAPWIAALWLGTLVLLLVGFLGQRGVIQLPFDDAFRRSGSLVLGLVLFFFFVLEGREFFTGTPAETFDAAGHVVPRKVVGPHVAMITLIATIVAGFGDLIPTRGKR